MRRLYNSKKIKFYIGDVRDIVSVKNAMNGVDYIFHAAALKQVPSCEFFPVEAVKTNVLGVDNVLNAAIDERVKKVICLSTDKAAYPINAMGISKAMMERVFVAQCNGNIKGNDGKGIYCKVQNHRYDCDMWDTLWKCYVFPRLCNTAVH